MPLQNSHLSYRPLLSNTHCSSQLPLLGVFPLGCGFTTTGVGVLVGGGGGGGGSFGGGGGVGGCVLKFGVFGVVVPVVYIFCIVKLGLLTVAFGLV